MLQSLGRLAGCAAAAALTILCMALAAPSAQAMIPPPEQDPFYVYQGQTPLAAIAPGTVLKTRTGAYHVAGIPLAIKVVQLLYRSTDELGRPTTNVTSVLSPPQRPTTPRLVAYGSVYDSLSRDDEPSYAIAGGALSLGGLVPSVESAIIVPLLRTGYTVDVSDIEGQSADFAAGPEYGMLTLDSLRAALASPATGLTPATRVGLLGYSGGAIATEWAAELAPRYAPDINARLVGAAMGGVLVDPAHNLHYVDGSSVWAGIIPMAIVGISRSFGIDLSPYLSAYGVQLEATLQSASITQVLSAYPGLTWQQLAKPQYPEPETIPAYVRVANQLIMGRYHTPTVPLFIGQGAHGESEGTPGGKPGIGEGDGVMIAGDVRTLAREYCARGLAVEYREYGRLAHIGAFLPWLGAAVPWLADRFAGLLAPQDCSQIAPGNPLTPITVTPYGGP